MQETFKIFIRKIFLFTFIIAAIQFAITTQIPKNYVTNMWPVIILFFVGFNIVMHHYLLKSTNGRPQKFIFNFMISTTIKILLYLGIILVYVLINREDAIAFIAAFFLNYFLFTAFEISAVLKVLKQPDQK